MQSPTLLLLFAYMTKPGWCPQVVVDLPERRRNRSPQRQPPTSADSAQAADSAQPAVPVEEMEASEVRQSQGVQRPYSSRPEGPVGWIEPDSPVTICAAALGSASTVPGVQHDNVEGDPGTYKHYVTM